MTEYTDQQRLGYLSMAGCLPDEDSQPVLVLQTDDFIDVAGIARAIRRDYGGRVRVLFEGLAAAKGRQYREDEDLSPVEALVLFANENDLAETKLRLSEAAVEFTKGSFAGTPSLNERSRRALAPKRGETFTTWCKEALEEDPSREIQYSRPNFIGAYNETCSAEAELKFALGEGRTWFPLLRKVLPTVWHKAAGVGYIRGVRFRSDWNGPRPSTSQRLF